MIARDRAAVLLRASTYRRTRWKNGGGETMEIAISPIGSNLDNFDWRVSMATVASDGPFSIFAGVDRTLCILDGAGIQLRLADDPAQRLDDASAPWSFSGDVAAHARLIDGAVTDFNVMTRRDRFSHTVQRIRLQAGEQRDVRPDVRAVFCQAGVVSIETSARRERLEPRDTMLRHVPDGRAWRLVADAAATVCLVTISESAAPHPSTRPRLLLESRRLAKPEEAP
jgi:environmental stress-induced protein Ves